MFFTITHTFLGCNLLGKTKDDNTIAIHFLKVFIKTGTNGTTEQGLVTALKRSNWGNSFKAGPKKGWGGGGGGGKSVKNGFSFMYTTVSNKIINITQNQHKEHPHTQ